MASHSGLNYSVTPAVIKDKYGMDDEASRLEQYKKWVMVGVVSFVVVLLIAFGIYSTRETSTDVVINNADITSEGNTTPIAPIQEPNQEIQQPVEPQPNEQGQPSVSDLPPRQQLISRWKMMLINNWKITVPIAVFVVIALVAGIVAAVMISEEQKRVEAELAAAEEAARQLELARQLEEQEKLLQVPSLKSGSIFMTVLTTHVFMSILTIIVIKFIANYNIKLLLKILAAIIITGHSFLLITVCLFSFFRWAVNTKNWGYSLKAKLILAPLWFVYSAFMVVCMPFVWLVGDKMGLMTGASGGMWTVCKDVLARLRA